MRESLPESQSAKIYLRTAGKAFLDLLKNTKKKDLKESKMVGIFTTDESPSRGSVVNYLFLAAALRETI